MESPLTKNIKARLRQFKPQMPTPMRTIRWADEVATPTGFVDVIRFEDYVANDKGFCIKPVCCRVAGQKYSRKACIGCVYKRANYELGILTTCYEVKISVSDFKSSNGHNFHGNRNYYAVPVEIYGKIEKHVPDGVGVIVYYSDSGKMLVKRECEHREISADTLARLLYDAFKKWVGRHAQVRALT